MISISEIEQLHKILISNFGGSHGLRDKVALQSALERCHDKTGEPNGVSKESQFKTPSQHGETVNIIFDATYNRNPEY
jgi:hypothetical protein